MILRLLLPYWGALLSDTSFSELWKALKTADIRWFMRNYLWFMTMPSILSIPCIYNVSQSLLERKGRYKIIVEDYLNLKPFSKVLDLGCGTARFLDYLPLGTDYTGFDLCSAYIKAAKFRYGDRGQFYCKHLSHATLIGTASFDYVLAIGILHHLNDCEANQLFRVAYQSLKSGGKLLTYDGVIIDRQSLVNKLLLKLDRGKYIRRKESYLAIAEAVFSDVTMNMRHNIGRLPYSHCIMTAIKEEA